MALGHDRLTPEGRRFFKELEELKHLEVRVGFQGDGTLAKKRMPDGSIEDSDSLLVDVVAANELGTDTIPSRPFMRKSVDENEGKIRASGKEQVKRLVAGATAKDILEKLGAMQAGLVQEKIIDGDFAPNAPSTLRKYKQEGSKVPLIETGQMNQSVHFTITEKGSGD